MTPQIRNSLLLLIKSQTKSTLLKKTKSKQALMRLGLKELSDVRKLQEEFKILRFINLQINNGGFQKQVQS